MKILYFYILGGLGPDYDALVVSVTSRPESITLNDLHGLLLSHETRLENLTIVEQGFGQANYTTKKSTGNPNGNRNLKGEVGYKRYSSSNDFSGERSSRGRGRRGSNGNRDHGHNSNGSSQCQLCNKSRHIALNCYHHFDHAYQSASKML